MTGTEGERASGGPDRRALYWWACGFLCALPVAYLAFVLAHGAAGAL